MSGLPRWRLLGLLVASFTAGFWLLGPPAQAHNVYESAFVWYWNGEERCAHSKSLINFDKQGGPTKYFTEVTGSLYLHALQVPCDAKLNKWSVAPGRLEVDTVLYVTGLQGTKLCAQMKPKFNGVTTWRIRQYRYWAYSTLRNCARSPDDNFWGIYGGTWAYYNGNWGGDWVWSGWH